MALTLDEMERHLRSMATDLVAFRKQVEELAAEVAELRQSPAEDPDADDATSESIEDNDRQATERRRAAAR